MLDLLRADDSLRTRVHDNAAWFREQMPALGFTLAGAGHAIIPVMVGDAALATELAARMLERGVYVVGLSYPVVPMGQARIRTQMSAAHTKDDLGRADPRPARQCRAHRIVVRSRR